MVVEAVIEMPTGSIYKYEFDKITNLLRLDRPLRIEVPFNYGFVPNTMSSDGDPLDVFVISSRPILPGVLLSFDLVGAFKCLDNGQEDDKLVGRLVGDECPYDIESIKEYLTSYKAGFQVNGYCDKYEAERILEVCRSRFSE
jgi:inorganic pyrophosphatase